MIKGFKRVAPNNSRRRLPITPNILGKLREVWNRSPKQWDAKMLWAACGLCFFGFFRSGEVVAPSAKQYDPASHLCFEDIMVDCHSNPSFIQVN